MEQKNIDLREFRKSNNLSQKELAEFLGVTVGFVSSVEHGRAKLPKDKIEKILVGGKEKGWDTRELIPLSSRILLLGELVRKRIGVKNMPYEDVLGLSKEDMNRILSGHGTITQRNVKQIRFWIPDVNIDWLMTGQGDIFLKEDTKCFEDEIYKELREMRSELKKLSAAVRRLAKIAEKK